MATVEVDSPSKEEIHSLLTNAPSLRCISEMNEGVTRNLESQWHKIYIGWHAILGYTIHGYRRVDRLGWNYPPDKLVAGYAL